MANPETEEDSQKKLPLESSKRTEDAGAVILPPVVPPQTTAPFTLNQQVNIQQIPTKAWDKLSPDQIVELTKVIIDHAQKVDERHFTYSMEQAKQTGDSARMSVLVGGGIAALGLIGVSYLALKGEHVIAGIIGTFLATIVAVVVGRKIGS